MGRILNRKVKITVGIPVHNGRDHVSDAIASIRSQSTADIEILIVDDGSVDGTDAVVKSIPDRRIRLIRNDSNRGVAAARNQVLDAAVGDYLVWLDADDWSAPTRIDEQVAALQRHPTAVLCTSWTKSVSSLSRKQQQGEQLGQPVETPSRPPFRGRNLKAALLFGNPIPMSATTLKLADIRRHGIRFHESLRGGEDYRFWVDLRQVGSFLLVPKRLTHRHEVSSGLSSRFHEEMLENGWGIQRRLIHDLGIDLDHDMFEVHRLLGGAHTAVEAREFMPMALTWAKELRRRNQEAGIYASRGLDEVLVARLAMLIKRSGLRLPQTIKFSTELVSSIPFSSAVSWLCSQVADEFRSALDAAPLSDTAHPS